MTVADQNLCGTSDENLISVCKSEQRCPVTLDLDFANPIRFTPANYAGMIVIRLPSRPSPNDMYLAVSNVLKALATEDSTGRLWIVERHRIREYLPDTE